MAKIIMEQCGFTDSVEMEVKDGSLILSSHKKRLITKLGARSAKEIRAVITVLQEMFA